MKVKGRELQPVGTRAAMLAACGPPLQPGSGPSREAAAMAYKAACAPVVSTAGSHGALSLLGVPLSFRG